MPFWLSDSFEVVAKKDALLILQVDYGINDAMLAGALAYSVACHDDSASSIVKAQCVQNMRRVVAKVRKDLEHASHALGDLVLLRSPALYLQWMDNLSTMAEAFMDMVVRAKCNDILTTSRSIDALSPRWGDYINEKGIEKQLAKIQMVDNRRLASDLPIKLRDLNKLLEECGGLGKIFGLSDDDARIKETRHIAMNSRSFGSRTVKVAAALKVWFLPQADFDANVATVLAFQSVLPACLVQALERKRDGKGDEALPVKPSKTQLKRPRALSATSLGRGSPKGSPPSGKKPKSK